MFQFALCNFRLSGVFIGADKGLLSPPRRAPDGNNKLCLGVARRTFAPAAPRGHHLFAKAIIGIQFGFVNRDSALLHFGIPGLVLM